MKLFLKLHQNLWLLWVFTRIIIDCRVAKNRKLASFIHHHLLDLLYTLFLFELANLIFKVLFPNFLLVSSFANDSRHGFSFGVFETLLKDFVLNQVRIFYRLPKSVAFNTDIRVYSNYYKNTFEPVKKLSFVT